MAIEMYSMDTSRLEDYIDTAKITILTALASEGVMTTEDADVWAESHAVILRKKSIFRTISDKWKNKKADDSHYFIVVKKI